MFTAKDFEVARAIKPGINLARLDPSAYAWLKIAQNANSSSTVYNATIENGIAYFDRVTASQPLVSLKLNIPVTQTGSGTPSPDNIRDFIGFSGVNVQRTGKNLFDINSDKITGAYISSTGAIVYQAGQDIYTEKIKFKPSTQYTISGKSDTNTIIRIALYSANNSFIGRVLTTSMKNPVITITPTSQASYFVINPDNTITDIQVEEGQQATAYEPFGNTYQITFGQTVYSAIFDVLTGKLYLTHELKTIDENSDISMSTTGTGIFYLNDFFDIEEDTESVDCNVYQRAENRSSVTGVINNNPDYSFCCKLDTYNTRILIKDTRFTTLEDYKTWLSTNPVKIAVKLATPIEVQLTPTQITTLIGENVIFADVANVTECKYTMK